MNTSMSMIQIKKTVKAGNSSAVVLPKAWLNKEVRVELVEKSNEVILNETFEILRGKISLDKIIGVYLAGSYARGEETRESDIDVLVITDGVDVNMINQGSYNIFVVSSMFLKYKLENDILPIGAMIKEAKPLLNSAYLRGIYMVVTKKNVKWYLNTTKEKLRLIRKALDKLKNKQVPAEVVYTLVLRIRTLYIIERLIENEPYLKKDFIKLIRNISGGNNSYEGYIAIKNDLNDNSGVSIKEAEKLYVYLKDYLNRVIWMIK